MKIFHDEWEEKIIARMEGELSAEESLLLDQHIESCASCAQELREYDFLAHRLRSVQKDIVVPAPPPTLLALQQEIAPCLIQEEVHQIVEQTFGSTKKEEILKEYSGKWIVDQCIEDLRYKSRLTQADLAEALNVSVRTVQRWENGKHNPNRHNLNRILQLESALDEDDDSLRSQEGIELLSDEVGIGEPLSAENFSVGETHQSHEKQRSEADIRAAMSDTIWRNLYPDLHSLACYLLRTSPLPYWRGQEDDMAYDIAQETVRRVIERAQKAMRGEAPPIQSLKQMANTVAYNYFRDLKRHDYRLSRFDTADASTSGARFYPANVRSDEYLLDLVADKVDQDRLFDLLASEISHFPVKQKQAILIDLANRMSFDKEPTSLQESFLEVGVELRDYRQALPVDQRERGRHISLCSQAYKRVAQLLCTRQSVRGAKS